MSSSGTGASTIRNTHSNIVCTARTVNGVLTPFFQKEYSLTGRTALHEKLASMTISQIVSLVESCSPEELAFMEDGARMNSALADYGMQHKLGIGAASSLAKYCRTDIMGNSLMSRIMTLMASSAEGRMCGCPYAVMSSAGSGNHGLTTILPVVETARYLGSDKEHLVKALAISHSIIALSKILPMQRSDFEGILEAMDGLGVTIRLLDPPLHEFTPNEPESQKYMAEKMGISVEVVKEKVDALHEFNPMLGHRGCRLGITYPEITEMQARAIIEAACNLKLKGLNPKPEIMVPLVGTVKELRQQANIIRCTADVVFAEKGVKVDYMVGTMIEIPRAALTADQIAEVAEFFSFGTNDLTQMTFGYSRDDAGKFLPEYIKKGILKTDPFAVLDQEGVGQLVQMGAQKGRSTNSKLKLGICGEHGGEPSSVIFCDKVGMDYVSCSPFRVPIARLAAAQAAIMHAKK